MASSSEIYNRVPSKVTDKQIIEIDRLHALGKPCNVIAKTLGLLYRQVYQHLNKDKARAYNAKRIYKNKNNAEEKPAFTSKSTDKYVETGKPLPPVYKSDLKIIADKKLAELACKQMGLKDPVCPLSQRPMSYNANGWVWDGNKFVAGVSIHNDGMIKGSTYVTRGQL